MIMLAFASAQILPCRRPFPTKLTGWAGCPLSVNHEWTFLDLPVFIGWQGKFLTRHSRFRSLLINVALRGRLSSNRKGMNYLCLNLNDHHPSASRERFISSFLHFYCVSAYFPLSHFTLLYRKFSWLDQKNWTSVNNVDLNNLAIWNLNQHLKRECLCASNKFKKHQNYLL